MRIVILIVIIVAFFIVLGFLNNYKFYNNKYYKCSGRGMGKITDRIFKQFNLKNDPNDWNIYMPCGYNNVEKELKEINLGNNRNKIIFGINGCDRIVAKNSIWDIIRKTYGRHHAGKLMPNSYVLHDPDDIRKLHEDYDKDNIYILKKNIQRKEGLKLTSDLKEILEAYKEKYRVAQLYLRDLYLVNKRKVNLRIYLLVVIRGNKKQYFLCKAGKCIYTYKEYNDDDFDFESNITSYHLDMNVYKKNPRTLDDLIVHLNNDGKDGQQLFRNIEENFRYVCKAMDPYLYQSENIKGTTTFQLFGADVVFDNNMHPYLLEFNKGPDMTGRDKTDEKLKDNVIYDMYALVGIMPMSGSTQTFFKIHES